MNEDRCCFPGCKHPSSGIYRSKPLCDTHTDLVMHDDPKRAARACAQIKLPPLPKCVGRMARGDEWRVACSVCGASSTYFLAPTETLPERPVCTWHTVGNLPAWDGVVKEVQFRAPVSKVADDEGDGRVRRRRKEAAAVEAVEMGAVSAVTATVPEPAPEPVPDPAPAPAPDPDLLEPVDESIDWAARFANGEYDDRDDN